MKGQMVAIEQASIAKKCNIQFQGKMTQGESGSSGALRRAGRVHLLRRSASISISIDRMAEPTTGAFRLRVHRLLLAPVHSTIAFLRSDLKGAASITASRDHDQWRHFRAHRSRLSNVVLSAHLRREADRQPLSQRARITVRLLARLPEPQEP